MSTTLTLDAAPYVEAVRALLGVLPVDERDELVDDLTAHLAELAAEGGPSLREQLGTPSTYAHEFVTSAGVVVDEPLLRPRVRDTLRLPPSMQTRLGAFRPSWLVLRPFLIVFGAATVLNGHLLGGVGALEIIVLGLIGAATIGLSQRLAGTWDHLASIAGVIALFVVIGALSEGRQYIYVDNTGYGPPGVLMRGDGSIVSNIWAYDRNGQPIDAFLFDQSGRPIDDVGSDAYDDRTGEQLFTEPRRDSSGAVVPNLYPREQTRIGREPDGTARRERDRPPALVTPRLDRETSTTTTSTTAPPTTTTTSPAQP